MTRNPKLWADRVKAIKHVQDSSHLVRGSLGDGEEAPPLNPASATAPFGEVKGPRMGNSIVLAADASQLSSLPATFLGSHPSRMLPCGPPRRLAIRAPRPRLSTELPIRGP